MKRQNTMKIGDVLNEFLEQNPELHKSILEQRIQNAWSEVLGTYIMEYTKSVYVRNEVLFVHLTSSVLRSELSYGRERLIKSLNDHVGTTVIRDIIFR